MALDCVHLGWLAECTYFQNILSHLEIGWSVVLRACDHYFILLIKLITLSTNGSFFSTIIGVIFKGLDVSPYQSTEIVSFPPVSWMEMRTRITASLKDHLLVTLILISPVPRCLVCVNVHSMELWTWGFSFPHLIPEKPRRFIPRAQRRMTWVVEICHSLGENKGLCGIRRSIRIKQRPNKGQWGSTRFFAYFEWG